MSAKGHHSKTARIHHVVMDSRTHKSLVRAVARGRGKRIYGQIAAPEVGTDGPYNLGPSPGVVSSRTRVPRQLAGPTTNLIQSTPTGAQLARGGTDAESGSFLTRNGDGPATYGRGYVAIEAGGSNGRCGCR
jgi:hypothetical protein